VPRGAIFYGQPRRRLEIAFTADLRSRTETLAATMHRFYDSRLTPPAQPAAHCKSCSLVDICLPSATDRVEIGARWRAAQLSSLRQEI
jgi:CRISPR-associated exonuclease Cas4